MICITKTCQGGRDDYVRSWLAMARQWLAGISTITSAQIKRHLKFLPCLGEISRLTFLSLNTKGYEHNIRRITKEECVLRMCLCAKKQSLHGLVRLHQWVTTPWQQIFQLPTSDLLDNLSNLGEKNNTNEVSWHFYLPTQMTGGTTETEKEGDVFPNGSVSFKTNTSSRVMMLLCI